MLLILELGFEEAQPGSTKKERNKQTRMPLSRFQIRNEYSLADPQLYRAADKDDPEALLEGIAMAGLVGVLRQLGDLAESVLLFLSLTFSTLLILFFFCF